MAEIEYFRNVTLTMDLTYRLKHDCPMFPRRGKPNKAPTSERNGSNENMELLS